jgi:hypothetical protein
MDGTSLKSGVLPLEASPDFGGKCPTYNPETGHAFTSTKAITAQPQDVHCGLRLWTGVGELMFPSARHKLQRTSLF